MKTSRRQFLSNAASVGLGTLAFNGVFPFAVYAANKRKLIAKVVPVNGILKLEINGKIFERFSFASFRPETRNISEFYKAGLRCMTLFHSGINCTLDVPYSRFGEFWIGLGKYDFSAIDRQMELFIKNAPEAYFDIMFQLDTRDWYLKEHPTFSNSYWNLVEMAGVQQWRIDTAQYLQDVLRYFEEKYGDRVISYNLSCGSSTEWYTNSQGNNRPEAVIRQNSIKEACFR